MSHSVGDRDRRRILREAPPLPEKYATYGAFPAQVAAYDPALATKACSDLLAG